MATKTFTQFRVDNVVTTLPTTLSYGQEVYYKDANGNLTLWVGHEDGTAWPVVGYKECRFVLQNDPNGDWGIGASGIEKTDFDINPSVFQVLSGPTRVDISFTTQQNANRTISGAQQVYPSDTSSQVDKSITLQSNATIIRITNPEGTPGSTQSYSVYARLYPPTP